MGEAAIFIAALRYAERGWHVFPCKPKDKAPATKNGLLEATTDIPKIAHWWSILPAANVAVRTGVESGIVVLDVDGDAGFQSLRELEAAHGDLPRTASVVTPSGGQHYYFKHPGGEFRNSAGRLGVGLDTRGDGGYVLAPPSIAANDRRYEPDERTGMAVIPAWLIAASQPRPASEGAQPTSEWLEIIRGVEEGGRNHAMARFVGHLLRRYVDLDLTRELAHLVSKSKFKPPLPGWEIERTLLSVQARELRRREASNAGR